MKKLFYLANLLTLSLVLSVSAARAQAPTITASPVSTEVCNGSATMFSAHASGTGVYYSWEVFDGTTWSFVTDGAVYSGATTDTIHFTAATSMSGYFYRAKAISGTDTSVYTGTATLTVDTVLTAISLFGGSAVCAPATLALTPSAAGGTWASATGNSSVSTAGMVSAIHDGSDTITYTFTNACNTQSATQPVTVNVPATLSGAAIVCTTGSITLTASEAGGAWMATNTNATVIGGVVTGVATGIDTIMYITNSSCGNDTAWHVVTVEGPLTIGSITGSHGVCTSTTITLTAPTTGGSWSISNSNATISTSGVVAGVVTGLDTVTYHKSNSCGSFSSTGFEITIDTALGHSTITGASVVCTSLVTALTADMTGGSWTATNGNATVSSGGFVTGVAGGIDTIKYTTTNVCSSDVAMHIITVEIPLTTGSISGPASVCTGAAISLAATVAGGTWSITNGNATITSVGVVSGVTLGLDTVIYSVTNSCGASSSSHYLTVNTAIGHAILSGASSVCIGSAVSILSTMAGGSWSATNGHASVSTSGMVTGVTAGVDTIIYTTVGACNTDVAMMVITIDAPLTAGTVAGVTSLCSGSTSTYTATATGGAWFSSNTAVAIIDASGVLTGRAVGTTVVSYAQTNACGTVAAVITVSVSRTASMISGSDSVGIGATTTYTDSAAGGTWTSSDTLIATVSTTGVITGIDTGMATITYMVTNICGTSWSTKTITVGPSSTAGVIFGLDSVCVGSIIALSDTLAPGGVWSVTNTNASISPAGILTGDSSETYDTVIYTVTNGFGTVTTTKVIKIAAAPPVVIVSCSDSATIAVGTTSHLLRSNHPGGTFMSTNTYVATFTTTSGNFVVLHRGFALLIYTYTNACSTGKDTFAINLPPLGVNTVNDENSTTLNVYPNPNNGTFSVNLLSSIDEDAQIIVTNMVGETVADFKVATNKANEITLNQPAGLYMITAITSNGRYVVKATIAD